MAKRLHTVVNNVNFKICSKCKESKPYSEFYFRTDKPHLLQYHCIECLIKKRKQYRLQNKEKFKLKDKIYHLKNRDKRLSYLKKYQQTNLHKRRINDKKRRKTDIHYNLRHKIHTRIKRALNINVLNRLSKSEKSKILLGCSIFEFKKYFESMFTNNMNWGKFLNGEIHIDHIKPCSSFDLSKRTEQMECFNYKNLQPLFAIDNILKSNKMEVSHR